MQPVNAKYKKEEKKIPNLRFPGFEGEWNLGKIKDIGQVITGSTPPTSNPEFYGGDKLFVSPVDIQENRFVESTKTTLTEAGFRKGRLIKKGGVFFVCIGSTIGKVGQAVLECITNQQINSIVANDEHDENFICSLLEFKSQRIKVLAGVQAVPIINKSTFEKYNLQYPSLPEQQKIASFLSAVDQKIQQLTRKKELLELYKKGVMQKIFSQEIKFKQEDGNDFPDWEVIRAKDVFKNHSNKNHNGDLPILAASQKRGMVYRDSIDIQIKSSEASVKSYKVVEKGDFVISLRSFQGGIEYSYLNGICSPAYTILKPVIPIIDAFFKFYFKKEDFIERLSKTIIGIRDGKQITYENFGWLKLNIPSNAEQQKISLFLSNIDNKIESIQTQIKQTQKFKKGLLQQMFV